MRWRSKSIPPITSAAIAIVWLSPTIVWSRFRTERFTFGWKDYSQGNRIRLMTLDAGEFIPRFLLHALPSRFMRLRHHGLLCNRDRNQKLARCRMLLP